MELSPLRLSYSEKSSLGKIKKSPRWDDEDGVAATVGTIMSLLVFMTFMGIFLNQFVPVWMSDNESAHMSDAMEQFVNLKSQVDGLIADNANSILASTPLFIPVTLSSPGIPVFAGPTAGILGFVTETISARPSFNVSYPGDTYSLGPTNDGHTGGQLRLYCPNRYFVEQTLVYECGAIIINQTDGEMIKSGMQLSVSSFSGDSVLKLTQISLVGTNKTVGGIGSKGVSADLLYASSSEYRNSAGSPVTITILTNHGSAWEKHFNRTLSEDSLIRNTDFTITNTKYDFTGWANDYYVVTVTILDINVFYHTRATVQIGIDELGV